MVLTVAQAAERLKVSPRAIRQFIDEGRLPAQKLGPYWILEAADVARFARRKRKVGRPS
jgi:excisionase family DNA binding protein